MAPDKTVREKLNRITFKLPFPNLPEPLEAR